MKKKIAIGMACNRTIKAKTLESLLKLLKHGDYEFEIIIGTEGYTIAENRLYVTVQAIKRECSHLLFIDDDMIFPPETLERLLSHQKDIVGVVYHSRNLTDNTTAVLEDGTVLKENFGKDLLKCSHVGTGVMLIDLSIVPKLQEPWFNFATLPNGFTIMGEDAWFCKQAREAGYEVWADPTLSISHIGDYLY